MFVFKCSSESTQCVTHLFRIVNKPVRGMLKEQPCDNKSGLWYLFLLHIFYYYTLISFTMLIFHRPPWHINTDKKCTVGKILSSATIGTESSKWICDTVHRIFNVQRTLYPTDLSKSTFYRNHFYHIYHTLFWNLGHYRHIYLRVPFERAINRLAEDILQLEGRTVHKNIRLWTVRLGWCNRIYTICNIYIVTKGIKMHTNIAKIHFSKEHC